jgi:hypothetical protein
MIKPGLLAALYLISATSAAWAYIDPNAGGLFLQIVAPLIAVVSTAWLVAKEKIATLLESIVHRFRSTRERRND